jgi:hypothetical protein
MSEAGHWRQRTESHDLELHIGGSARRVSPTELKNGGVSARGDMGLGAVR